MHSLPRVSTLFSSRSARISHASHTSGSVGRKALALLAAGGLMLATACGDGSAGSTDDSGANNATASESSTTEQTPEDEGPQPTGVDSKGSDSSDDDSNDSASSSDLEGEPTGSNHRDNDVIIHKLHHIPSLAFEGAGERVPDGEGKEITSGYGNFKYFVDSTGKIGCQIDPGRVAMCGSMGEKIYHDGDHPGVIGYVFFSMNPEAVSVPIAQTGVEMYYLQEGGPAMQLKPGDLVVERHLACGENEHGVTCWNYLTQSGVFIDHDLNAIYFDQLDASS